MKNLLLLFSLMVILFSCTPTIDASSEEAYQNSIEKMKSGMTEAEQTEFAEALMLVGMKGLSFADMMAAGGNENFVADNLLTKLEGKTAADILAEADLIKTEREAKQREQALQEIEELREARAAAETAKGELAKFEVSKSRFYKRKTSQYSSMLEPFMEIVVKNNTSSPISRAYFIGTIASPERSIPWHSDAFNYEIPGGLEPGEDATWVLAPNMFSDWGKVNAPKDAVFTVEVTQVDGADGEPLFSVNGFSEEDAERLEELEKTYQ